MISVTQFDAKTLRRMLDFMYEGRYDVSELEEHEELNYGNCSDPGKISHSSQKIIPLLTLSL